MTLFMTSPWFKEFGNIYTFDIMNNKLKKNEKNVRNKKFGSLNILIFRIIMFRLMYFVPRTSKDLSSSYVYIFKVVTYEYLQILPNNTSI